MIMSASPITSAVIPPKMGHSDNTPRNNRQSADTHTPVSSLSPKLVSGNMIPSCKEDEFAFCMIPKVAFIEEADNDNTDFEPAFHGRICETSILFAKDNQT